MNSTWRLKEIFFLWSISFFLLFLPNSSIAVSGSFIIDTLVGGDTTPPTIPTPFSVTPVASSQIDLTWGVSTDNSVLSGYHVWRDGLQIATTTSLGYSDTGLTASTTYTYYVTAYDSSFNESASSTAIATTTFDIPPPVATTTPGTTYGTKIWRFENEIVSLVVLPERDAVVIRYETKDYIKSAIKWGRTTSYELGSLLEEAYTKFHETRISGLTPGTRYQFTIEGQNRFDKYGELYVGEFMTLKAEDIFPPGNVTNLKATKLGHDVILSWTNPFDSDFSKVRVVSSELFYPGDIADGWVVYEGGGSDAIDGAVVQDGLWRYYTVFSYDSLGNISSGSVVRVYLGDLIDGTPSPTEPETDPTQNEIALNLTDVAFIQDGEILPIEDSWSIHIDGSKQLSIEIPYDAVPEHLKTILVVLTDSVDSNKIFKFLLRINADKNAYTSTLAPLGHTGVFPVTVSVFDFKTAQIGYAGGILVSEITSLDNSDSETSFIMKLIQTFTRSYLLLGIILLIALLYISRRLMRAQW